MWLDIGRGWLTDGLDLQRKGLFLIWVDKYLGSRYIWEDIGSQDIQYTLVELNWRQTWKQYIKWIGRDFKPVVLTWKYNSSCYRTKLGSALPRAVKPIYWHWIVVKESAVFILKAPYKENGWLVLRNPELHEGFQQSVFKGQVRERGGGSQGMWSAHAQFSDWLMVR